MSEHLQPGLHPDPDSLNAFIEGALPEHERLECVAHLAECAQCREVVYLAQEPLPVPASDRVSFWKRWFRPIPVLSAVAVAAAVLLLSVGIHRPEKLPNHSPVAMMPAPPAALEEPPAADAELPRKTSSEVPRHAAPHAVPARVVSVGVSAAPATAALPPAVAPQAAVAGAPPARQPAGDPQAEALLVNGSISAPISASTGIAGTITDPTGAAIAGATVTAHLVDGASTFVASADATGQFHIEGIQPGNYEVKVAALGFQPATKQVEVQKDHVAQADSELSVGSVTETVEVTAGAAALNTEAASAREKKSGIAALPLIGRIAQRKAAPATASPLPSNLAVVAAVQKDKVMLAVDAAGALFVSENAGQKWKAVKPAWQGKAAGLETSGMAFRLTTDGGAVWLSRDGAHWSAEKR
jgi:hypothetical protein